MCVVSPQREEVRPSLATSGANSKYMSIFETLLTNTTTSEQRKPNEKLTETDDSGFDTTVSASGSYRPSQSAASAILHSPPHHEYAQIVGKLTSNPSRQNNRVQSSDSDIRSNTASTAFRLINQTDPREPIKLQKYLVEGSASTVSTLISDSTDTLISKNKLEKYFPPRSSTSSCAPPLPSTSSNAPSHSPTPVGSIFQQLKSLKIKDERVEFV